MRKIVSYSLTYLVSGDGIGDIEAGVPETGDKGVEAEMGQQFLDIIDILILKYHNVMDIPIFRFSYMYVQVLQSPEVGESGEDHDEESPERRDRTWHSIIAMVMTI